MQVLYIYIYILCVCIYIYIYSLFIGIYYLRLAIVGRIWDVNICVQHVAWTDDVDSVYKLALPRGAHRPRRYVLRFLRRRRWDVCPEAQIRSRILRAILRLLSLGATQRDPTQEVILYRFIRFILLWISSVVCVCVCVCMCVCVCVSVCVCVCI